MGGLRVTSDCSGYLREAYGTIVRVKHPERVPRSHGFGWGTVWKLTLLWVGFGYLGIGGLQAVYQRKGGGVRAHSGTTHGVGVA